MRRLSLVSLFCLVTSAAAISATAPPESWGKAGITLQQYRQDALECGLRGYYADISKTEDAKVFVNASKQLDAINSGASAPMTVESSGVGPDTTNEVQQIAQFANQQQHIVDNVRVDTRFRNIKQTLTSKTEQCLVDRGYMKFSLTGDQRKALAKLKPGSDQRREYLYHLASDPIVLSTQSALAARSH